MDDEGQQPGRFGPFFVVPFDGVIGLRGQRHICSIIQFIGINRLRLTIANSTD